jgi:hypothetical protein
MDYTKLARKLKKAGFGNFTPNVEDCQTGKKFTDVYMPSLEKLIEKLGSTFSQLHRQNFFTVKWVAVCPYMSSKINEYMEGREKECNIIGEGETAKEAVANLYLELKKRKII